MEIDRIKTETIKIRMKKECIGGTEENRINIEKLKLK